MRRPSSLLGNESLRVFSPARKDETLLKGAPTKYDLLLKGGRVVDKASHADGRMDIGVGVEVIVSMQRDINPLEGRRVMDLSGLIVAPGLIDFHTHAFLEAKEVGLVTDPSCLSSGVTTLVDGENLKSNG